MFYTDKPDNALRFGDVLFGLPSVRSVLNETISTNNINISFDVKANSYAVVLTPCCSIKDNYITISPLLEIDPNFLKNPYFVDDLCRINKLVPPEKRLPPERWERMSLGEQQIMIEQGEEYTFLNYFIYDAHDLLPAYKVKTKDGYADVNHYMVDFKGTTVVQSKEIITAEKSPLCVKNLQLTIQSRKILRDKISNFYTRIPAEDAV